MKKWVCCLLGMLGLAAAQGVVADIDEIDLSLENLVEMRVVSMPKFAENVDNIPAVVSILKREDIRAFGWRTLGDALRSLQGFNVTSDHTYQFAGVRGISQPGDYRPRLQILIDGIAINENLYASAPVDSSFPLDLDLVERIEVVRGPSASVFGGDAMFGVINVVTRSGQSMAGREFAASYGTGQEAHGRLSWGGRIGDYDMLVSATRFGSGGRRLSFDDQGASGQQAIADQVGREQGDQLFLRLRGSDWRVTLIANERDKTVPTGSYGTIFNDPGHREVDRYRLFDLAKDWRLGDGLVLRQRLYHGEYRYEGRFPFDYSADVPPQPRVVNQDLALGQWWGFENHLGVTRGAHQLTFGIEFRNDSRQNQQNQDLGFGCYNAVPEQRYCLDSRQSGHQMTVFVQDEITLTAATRLSVGLRHDQNSVFGGFWSPRLGLVQDAGAWGLFKALYGSAYRTPSVYERFYQSDASGAGYGNPGLGHEQMESFELAWEKALGPLSRLTTSVYEFAIDGMITPDSLGTARNGSRVRAQGIELDFEHRWDTDRRLRLNYSLQRPQGPASLLDNSPRQMLKANLVVPAGYPDLKAGLELQYVDRRLAASGTATVPGYTTGNLNLLYSPRGQSWDLSLSIRNLFDARFKDPVSSDPSALPYAFPQMGRNLLLKTTVRF